MLTIEPISEIENFAGQTGFLAVNLKRTLGLCAERDLGVVMACPDLANRDKLITLVTSKGLKPLFASTLKETTLLLKLGGIALVICQASFPDGDYRNLLRAAVGFGAVPPVIVCADWYDPGAYVEAKELGAFAYLTFPFRRDGVEEVVDEALEKPANRERISHLIEMAPLESHCCLVQ